MDSLFKATGTIPTKPNGEMWGDEEYFACKDHLHSSNLYDMAFMPDKLFYPLTPKSYFDIGHAFEAMVEDRASGSHKFDSAFFMSANAKAPPEKMPELLKSTEDLSELYVYTKTGGLNKTHANKHAWLDEYILPENQDKTGISKDDSDMLLTMLENFFRIKIIVYEKEYSLARLLASKDTKYQVPIKWDGDGVKKLAYLDILIYIPELRIYIALDIKTSASERKFYFDLKEKYWLQSMQYVEGLKTIAPNVYPYMIFLASFKEEPYHARAFHASLRDFKDCEEAYKELCLKWQLRKDCGEPRIGAKTQKEVRIFPKDLGSYTIPTGGKSIFELHEGIKETEYEVIENEG